LGKDKLKRFREIDGYSHVLQPPFEEAFRNDYKLKGRWAADFFHNNNPLVLELGCGRGEYTVALAKKFPERNFIGIDIKGARIWKGARDSLQENLKNTAFLRTRIEIITSFFGTDEVDEIWITFPDPQVKQSRVKKRLTGPWFLNASSPFLKETGIIHLKTDSIELYNYTGQVVAKNKLTLLKSTPDIYNEPDVDEILETRTYYEKMFLKEGKKIAYMAFMLNGKGEINDL
jgi:tRNA (guanine-N7-)-methyltransferase